MHMCLLSSLLQQISESKLCGLWVLASSDLMPSHDPSLLPQPLETRESDAFAATVAATCCPSRSGLQVAIAVMHLGRLNVSSDLLSVLMAFQVLLLWINKVQYFSRCAFCYSTSPHCKERPALGDLSSLELIHDAWRPNASLTLLRYCYTCSLLLPELRSQDIHPLHSSWNVPRRIRRKSSEVERCSDKVPQDLRITISIC